MIWWGRYSRKSLGIDFDGWSRPMMLLIRPAAACLALAFFLAVVPPAESSLPEQIFR